MEQSGGRKAHDVAQSRRMSGLRISWTRLYSPSPVEANYPESGVEEDKKSASSGFAPGQGITAVEVDRMWSFFKGKRPKYQKRWLQLKPNILLVTWDEPIDTLLQPPLRRNGAGPKDGSAGHDGGRILDSETIRRWNDKIIGICVFSLSERNAQSTATREVPIPQLTEFFFF